MTDPRPRFFTWLEANGRLSPQIWFDEPRVGCGGMTVRAERKLETSEYAMTVDELVKKYPAPEMV